ncbi:MAG: hypothetical protein JWR50_12 [Mucilaginibacter sp.]|nr:hypothetical protein [Mucilaginibacter sp.]
MAYRHLFLDSDILLDMFFERKPFSIYTQGLLFESEKRQLKLNTSSLVIANINYLLRKKIGNAATRENIKSLVSAITVLPFEADVINLALLSSFSDFEDAIQFYIAKKYSCDAIITRNLKDYKESTIPVLTAEQFLRTL